MMHNDSLSVRAGKNLKRIIKERGLTQERFAELMYVDPTTLRRWLAHGIDKMSTIEEIIKMKEYINKTDIDLDKLKMQNEYWWNQIVLGEFYFYNLEKISWLPQDYSSVVICYASCIEDMICNIIIKSLVERSYGEFIKYIKTKYNGKISMKEYIKHKFTLGDFTSFYSDNDKRIIDTLNILNLCNITKEEFKSMVKNINEFRNDYRNVAGHKGILDKESVFKCRVIVIRAVSIIGMLQRCI